MANRLQVELDDRDSESSRNLDCYVYGQDGRVWGGGKLAEERELNATRWMRCELCQESNEADLIIME